MNVPKESLRIGLVVLNYNNAPETLRFLSRVVGIDTIGRIQVVDNASTDGSYEDLRSFCEEKRLEKLAVSLSTCNEGYGRGNNFGVSELLKSAQCRYLIIANPDVEFDAPVVSAMAGFLDANDEYAAVAPTMLSPAGKVCQSAWKLPTKADMVRNALRLAFPFMRDPGDYRSLDAREGFARVDALPGSFFMIRMTDFVAARGFDEDTFLYGEENLLFAKLREAGRPSALLDGATYVHAHGTSITKEVSSVKRRYLIQLDSNLVYCDKILRMSRLGKSCYTVLFKLCLSLFSTLCSTRAFLVDGRRKRGRGRS